jgi:hypothetical protein
MSGESDGINGISPMKIIKFNLSYIINNLNIIYKLKIGVSYRGSLEEWLGVRYSLMTLHRNTHGQQQHDLGRAT